jgi:hypothetical protein
MGLGGTDGVLGVLDGWMVLLLDCSFYLLGPVVQYLEWRKKSR